MIIQRKKEQSETMKDFVRLKELVEDEISFPEEKSVHKDVFSYTSSDNVYLDTFTNQITVTQTYRFDLLFATRYISLNSVDYQLSNMHVFNSLKELANHKISLMTDYLISPNKKEKKNAYSFSMFLAEDSVRNELLEDRALELKEYFQNNPESLKRLKKKLSELDWGFQKQLLNYLEYLEQ